MPYASGGASLSVYASSTVAELAAAIVLVAVGGCKGLLLDPCNVAQQVRNGKSAEQQKPKGTKGSPLMLDRGRKGMLACLCHLV